MISMVRRQKDQTFLSGVPNNKTNEGVDTIIISK